MRSCLVVFANPTRPYPRSPQEPAGLPAAAGAAVASLRRSPAPARLPPALRSIERPRGRCGRRRGIQGWLGGPLPESAPTRSTAVESRCVPLHSEVCASVRGGYVRCKGQEKCCSELHRRRRSGPDSTSIRLIAPSLAPVQITVLAPVLTEDDHARARKAAPNGLLRFVLGCPCSIARWQGRKHGRSIPLAEKRGRA
jgi:hypothetical protein